MVHKMIPTTRRGDVTFHADGRIDLTAHVSRQLQLESGDVIGIATTDGSPCEHLLYVARRHASALGRHACTCKSAKGHGRYLRLHSKALATHILGLCHAEGRLTLLVGEATEVGGLGLALPLITAPFLQAPMQQAPMQQPIFIDPEH